MRERTREEKRGQEREDPAGSFHNEGAPACVRRCVYERKKKVKEKETQAERRVKERDTE